MWCSLPRRYASRRQRESLSVLVNGIHLLGATKLRQTLDGEASCTATPNSSGIILTYSSQFIAVPHSECYVSRINQLLSIYVLWYLNASKVRIRNATVLGLVTKIPAGDQRVTKDT